MSKDTRIQVENRTKGTIVLDISADEALILQPGRNAGVSKAVWDKAMALPAAKGMTTGDIPALTASLPVG